MTKFTINPYLIYAFLISSHYHYIIYIFDAAHNQLNLCIKWALTSPWFFFYFAWGANQSPDLPDNYWHIQCLSNAFSKKRVCLISKSERERVSNSWILILLLHEILRFVHLGGSAAQESKSMCVGVGFGYFSIYVQKFITFFCAYVIRVLKSLSDGDFFARLPSSSLRSDSFDVVFLDCKGWKFILWF